MSTVKDDPFGHLRNRALSRVQGMEALPDLSGVEVRALYHELQVHQAELQMQNEQLRESQYQLEHSLQKYRELFECIPIGYAIVDSWGRVLNCNAAGFELLKLKTNTSFTLSPRQPSTAKAWRSPVRTPTTQPRGQSTRRQSQSPINTASMRTRC